MNVYVTVPVITAAVIKHLRMEKGLKQSEMVGLTTSIMSRIESGQVAISLQNLSAIAKVLEVRASDILVIAERMEDFLRAHSTLIFVEEFTEGLPGVLIDSKQVNRIYSTYAQSN